MLKSYYVYIATNYQNTVFYIGVTNNLERRAFEHKNGVIDGFTKKYKVNKIVFFEQTSDIGSALEREKQLKRWHRDWKINLIKNSNPDFKDLLTQDPDDRS